MAFVPKTRAERENGLTILTRPTRFRQDVRTEEDNQYNRDLTAGRLKPNAVVEVTDTRPAETGQETVEGHYVRIAGDASRGIPTGWVHNKPRVAPDLLAEACLRAGVHANKAKLENDAAYRAQVLKDCTARARNARDKARALTSAMPAALPERK